MSLFRDMVRDVLDPVLSETVGIDTTYTRKTNGDSFGVRLIPARPAAVSLDSLEPTYIEVELRDFLVQAIDLEDTGGVFLPASDDLITDDQGKVFIVSREVPYRYTDNDQTRIRIHTVLDSSP